MQVEGIVSVIGEVESFGSNGFTKRLLVVKTTEQYPQDIPVEFVKDKTSLLDALVDGDSVKVSINLRGREHNGKYYLSAQGWRIDIVE
tara:strand:+ start:2804 stop:3067 length:264 start_codon:yes stop_codon:yes gene_type:complete